MPIHGKPQSGVTYLIPAYNPDKTLLKTIQSITRSNLLHEILVINDYSTEGLNFLREVQKIPYVRVVDNKQEKGISGALNTGLSEVRSEYVARLDAGDIDLPNRITRQLHLLRYENADLVVSDMLIRAVDKSPNVVSKAYYAKVCGVIAPWSIVPHPTWLFRIGSLLHPYRAECIRTEDYCFLAENNLRISVSHEPAIVYDGRGKINVRNEILATYIKVKTFVIFSRNPLIAVILGTSYGLARIIRILIWPKKYIKR